jgi:hypothetical protein
MNEQLGADYIKKVKRWTKEGKLCWKKVSIKKGEVETDQYEASVRFGYLKGESFNFIVSNYDNPRLSLWYGHNELSLFGNYSLVGDEELIFVIENYLRFERQNQLARLDELMDLEVSITEKNDKEDDEINNKKPDWWQKLRRQA